MHKVRQHPDPAPGVGDLSVLPERRIEIIRQHRQIVRIAGRARLLQCGQFSLRIRPAVIHVIAEQIAAASQLDHRHTGSIIRRRNRPPVVRHLQAAAQLRREIGEPVHVKRKSLAQSVVRADPVIVALGGKDIIAARLDLRQPLIPGRFTIAAHDRQHSAGHRAAPAGRRVNRNVIADFPGHFEQRPHMPFTFFAGQPAAMSVLILDLHADDRSAVL